MQVLDGRMYIAGETQGFGDIQDRMKKLLAHVWSRYAKQLPDVDMMIQFDDWMLPNLKGQAAVVSAPHCRVQSDLATAMPSVPRKCVAVSWMSLYKCAAMSGRDRTCPL